MEKEEKKIKRRKSIFRVPEELKLEIARERLLEGKPSSEIAKNHGLHVSTVYEILRNFAAENSKSALFMKKKETDNLSEENEALRKEIMELKRKLYDETMRADFYDTMIDVAEEMFNIEIRKKADTGQSKGCTKGKGNTR